MFNPPVASYISFLYALGNTPAVNLVRDQPQGADADILLLGCGDVRNILFTAYALEGLPRNAFFFSLLSEEHAIKACTAWSIYYELYLSNDTASLVRDHVARLLEASESLASWRESRFGELLSFCDAGTLRLVRRCWLKMSSVAADPEAKTSYLRELQRTRDLKKLAVGDGTTVPSLRSAAPVALQAIQSIRDTNKRFWTDGTLTQSRADKPNPLFHHALSENMVLHYGTDPLLGFHLATAFVSLAPASPLMPRQSGGATISTDIVAAAQAQFEAWVAAFRRLSKQGLKVRFAVSDALAFCHTLQSKAGIDNTSANIYRRQFDVSTCDLDPEEYGVQGKAPRLFDVIDTSNLADHFGLLNYLVAAKPLLKDAASSAIYTETLLASMNTGQSQLDALLCGPGPTVSLLLGLSAVEYWTNATSISYAEEMAMTKAGHCRLSWKFNHHLAGCAGQTSMVRADSQSVAKILFSIYLGMFKHEKEGLVPYTSPEQREKARRNSFPPFHRGNLATITKLLQTTVESEWTEVCQALINMISNDRTLSGGSAFMHEFLVQLHLQGIYTEPWLSEKVIGSCAFHSWESVPKAVVLTLVVPREHFNKLYAETILKFNAPTLQLSVTSDHQNSSASMFQDVHVVFGAVRTHGSPDHHDFSVSVQEDDGGWNGSSPLIMSCYVPSAVLHSTPKSSKIGLRVQPNRSNLTVLQNTGIGPDFVVYETSIDDASHAFITRHLPCTQGHPAMFRSPTQPPRLELSTEQSWLSVSTAEDSSRVSLITAHVDIVTDEGKKLLADKIPIKLRQTSPFNIDVVFGKNILVTPLCFALPVLKEDSSTRIARKSGYIEVIAPIAEPLDAEPLVNFIYPIVLGPKSVPLTLNSHHLNLDMLPMLNVEPEHRKSNQFLVTFASFQFSERERQLRDSAASTKAGISSSLRLNFKETLFSIFMLASGLQGGQTGVFSLNHEKLGVVLLLIVRSIRLDLAAGSLAMDAAILPLTVSMVTSGELEEFLLVLRELQICSINVNDEELRLWRQVIPAFVERCRTWAHGDQCEYAQHGGAAIPLTQETGRQFLCSCSHGTVPRDFVRIPGWDVASQYAVRAAVSPTFATPIVEDIVGTGGVGDLATGMVNLVTTPPPPACRACGKTAAAASSGKLMACSRCKEVSYCSRDCQKADWKKHRMECSTDS